MNTRFCYTASSGRPVSAFTSVSACIISSVVPPLTGVMEAISHDFFSLPPYVVGPGIKTGMPIHYDNPREVGADRIVNAVAGYEKHKCPLVIVDFGTATTFDYVNAKGEYCGGAIAPGLAISLEALFQRASKLPRVDIVKPPLVAFVAEILRLLPICRPSEGVCRPTAYAWSGK